MIHRKALVFALVASFFFIARAAMAETGYEKASTILKLPIGLSAEGKLQADSGKWKVSKDADGTEIMNLISDSDTRAAFMRNTDGSADAFASYSAKPGAVEKVKSETSNGLFFGKGGQIAAVTSCEETGAKDSIGRICVTATPRLCEGLRSGKGIDPEALKEMESFEMRALASILTLRGSEHQLDNVVRFGNRLGLKTALQTTKGQLIALAKQVAKETSTPVSEGTLRKPAQTDDRTKAESLMARTVLEKSMPKLKDACQAI